MIIYKTFKTKQEILDWYYATNGLSTLKQTYPPSVYRAILSFERKRIEITKKDKTMSKFKTLEKEDVRKVAKDLIKKNQKTTTLEIKFK